jgi:hypothetical protein
MNAEPLERKGNGVRMNGGGNGTVTITGQKRYRHCKDPLELTITNR